jgi:hypothetical protein
MFHQYGMQKILRFAFLNQRWQLVLLGLLFVLAGCARAPEILQGTQTPVAPQTSELPSDQDQLTAVPEERTARISPPESIPPVDKAMHNVPLEEIYFDTFQPVNRAVPLTEVSAELIERLRDAIPPIHNPVYETADQAEWLGEDDIVLGYTAGGQAWAYPVKILNFHEIVNDVLEGEPVLISYCPLCYSGIVFSRIVGDQELIFGNTSALYESDMVMLDYETGSYSWQVAGQAIVGELVGERLEVLPSRMATWAEWRQSHPHTLVLSRETGFSRDYEQDPFLGIADFINQGRFSFPVSPDALDDRLRPGDKVISIQLGGGTRAYLLDPEGARLYQDELDGEKLVVFSTPDGPSGSAYLASLDGVEYLFILEGGQFRDEGTGSIWDLSGRAIEGPLAGVQLEAIPSRVSFWFAIVAAEPGIELHGR